MRGRTGRVDHLVPLVPLRLVGRPQAVDLLLQRVLELQLRAVLEVPLDRLDMHELQA